jgi:translocator protein
MPSKKCFLYGSLAIWLALVLGAGVIIGLVIRPDITSWYEEQARAPLNPPNWVFPIAWTILYTLIAISGWILQFAKHVSPLTVVRVLFGLQLLLNWAWSFLFFSFHLTGLSFGIIVTLDILVAALIIVAFGKFRLVSLLLLPYLAWICFASYLNYYVWQGQGLSS